MGWGIVAVGVAALLAPGCQGTRRSDRGREALSRPVAIVNTEAVSLLEFQSSYQRFLARWDRFLHNDEAKNRELKELHLQHLIDERLLDQEARRKGIEVSQETLMAKIGNLVAPYNETYLDQATEAAHTTVAEWIRDYHRRMVHQKLIEKEVLPRIQVTDREVREYYDANPGEFAMPEQVRVRHICVGNRKTYDRVGQLLEGDVDFVELVRQFSITPDRQWDGDLGYVERGVLPPEFDQVIFEMTRVGSVNRLSRPVQTELGLHIFRLEGRREARRLSLEESTPAIRETLLRRKQSAAYATWIKRLREKATITVDKGLLESELG